MCADVARLALLAALAGGTACSDPGGTDGPPTNDGGLLWFVREPGSSTKPGVDTSGKVIFWYTSTRDLVALDAATGKEKWRTKVIDAGVGAMGEDIAVVGDVVAVGDVDVFAFRASTGERLWRHGRFPGGNEGTRPLGHDDTAFYLAGVDGLLTKVDARTGRDIWVRSLAHGDSAVAAFGPVVHANRVFACANRYAHTAGIDRGALSAFDKESGALLWRVAYEPNRNVASWCFSQVAAINGLVASGISDGRVVAHDPATGAIRWTTLGELTGNNGELVYVASDGTSLVSVSSGTSRATRIDGLTGRVIWRNSGSEGSPLSAPQVSGSTAVVTHALEMAAYDVATGSVLWKRPGASERSLGGVPNYRIRADALVHAGVAYIVADDGIRAQRLR